MADLHTRSALSACVVEAHSPTQRAAFRRAVSHMVEDLKAGRPLRPGLRVKGIADHPGVFEMTWADDGRATFHYGEAVREGDVHIVWRRIGTHEIFDNP